MGKNLETIGRTLFWMCMICSFLLYSTSGLYGEKMELCLVIQSTILSAVSLIGLALEIAGHIIAKRKE